MISLPHLVQRSYVLIGNYRTDFIHFIKISRILTDIFSAKSSKARKILTLAIWRFEKIKSYHVLIFIYFLNETQLKMHELKNAKVMHYSPQLLQRTKERPLSQSTLSWYLTFSHIHHKLSLMCIWSYIYIYIGYWILEWRHPFL